MKVNTKNIPEEYRELVKEEMTSDDIAKLGSVIIHMKIEGFKMKFYKLFRRNKNEKKQQKKVQ